MVCQGLVLAYESMGCGNTIVSQDAEPGPLYFKSCGTAVTMTHIEYLSPLPSVTLCLAILTLPGCSSMAAPTKAEAVQNNDHRFEPISLDSNSNYVKLAEVGYVVEKPFPKIYLVDRPTSSNRFTHEFAIVLSQKDQTEIVDIAVLACSNQPFLQNDDDVDQANEIVHTYRKSGLLITYRSQGKNAKTCFISAPQHCQFFSNLAKIELDVAVQRDENLQELENRTGCTGS